MNIGVGGIVSLGGGSSGSSGSGSGIQSINSQSGPTILINGVNGITVTAGGNILTINGASLSGLIGSQTPQSGVISGGMGGITVIPSGGNFIIDDDNTINYIQFIISAISGFVSSVNGVPTAGNLELVGVSGIDCTLQSPGVVFIGMSGVPLTTQSGVLGVNGIDVQQVGGNFVVDGSALSGISSNSGIQSINNDYTQQITLVGVSGIAINALGNGTILIGISGIFPDGSGLNSVNGQTGPDIQLIGQNGITIIPSTGNPNDIEIGITPGTYLTGQSGVLGVNGVDVQQIGGNFVVDAAALSGISTRKFSTAFTNQSSVIVNHNLGSVDVIVQVRDNSVPSNVIIPNSIEITDASNVTVYFNANRTGRVVVIG
jgi:hypothetical protein